MISLAPARSYTPQIILFVYRVYVLCLRVQIYYYASEDLLDLFSNSAAGESIWENQWQYAAHSNE